MPSLILCEKSSRWAAAFRRELRKSSREAGLKIIEVRSLRKTYGERVVLDDVSLIVDKGDVVCLIGSSGSGKSTLLRCLDLHEDIDDGFLE